MQPGIVVNAHRTYLGDKPVIFCIPDVKDSERFVARCYRNDINMVLLIRRKWIPQTDLTACLAHIVVDDLDLDHVPGLLLALRQVISEIPGLTDVDYFIAFSELNVNLLGILADRLRGVCLARPRSRTFRDKRTMRELAMRKNIACPTFQPVDGIFADRHAFELFIESVAKAAARKGNQAGYVLKPRDGWGSRGVRIFREPDALWQALQCLKAPGAYLVEEEISGKLVHVDSAVVGRKVVYQAIGVYDSSLLETDDAHGGHFMWHTMGTDGEIGRGLVQFNLRVLEAFDLEYGFSHTEVFIEDRTGDFVLCETACRPPGLRLLDLHAHASGVHAYDRFVDLLVQPEDAPRSCAPAIQTVGTIIFKARPGTLDAMRPLEEIVDSYVIAWEQFARSGDRFDDAHYTSQLGQIVCAAKSEIECVELLRRYEGRFSCSFDNAKG